VSVLLRPKIASDAYFTGVAPVLGQFQFFRGNVLAAMLDGAPVGSGRLDPAVAAKVRTTDSIALTAVVTSGPPTLDVAPIVIVFDATGNQIALLGQQRTALVFVARTKGADFGFSTPSVMMDAVFDTGTASARSPIRLEGVRRGGELRLRVTDATARTRDARLTLSPALGWALWLADTPPTRVMQLLFTAAWVFVPVAFIGFWFGGISAPLVAVVGAQIVVPLTRGPAQIIWLYVVISALGGVAGIVVSRLRSAPRNESLGASA
jgi:hypothetical protein